MDSTALASGAGGVRGTLCGGIVEEALAFFSGEGGGVPEADVKVSDFGRAAGVESEMLGFFSSA
jgi:hypothetical protein